MGRAQSTQEVTGERYEDEVDAGFRVVFATYLYCLSSTALPLVELPSSGKTSATYRQSTVGKFNP